MSKSLSTRGHRRLILLENRAMDTRHHRVHEGGEKQGANNRVLLAQVHSEWGDLAPPGGSNGRQEPEASVWSSLCNCQFKKSSETPKAQQLLHKLESQSLLRCLRDFHRGQRDNQTHQYVRKKCKWIEDDPGNSRELQTSHHTSENKDQLPALLAGYLDPLKSF